MSELRDIVSPELEPHRLRHPKAVDVEDSATHAELRDIFHHIDALEADRLEVRREILWPTRVALSDFQSRCAEGARQLGPFEERAAGGDEDAESASADALEG